VIGFVLFLCHPAQASLLVAVTTEQWDQMFAVHARGAFLCYKYAIKQMIKQGRGGRVVGACSVFGKKAGMNCAHYSAAKFAIRGLTQAAAQEVGKHGITVNGYAPGFINTPMVDGLPEPVRQTVQEIWKAEGYEGQPSDAANVVSFLLSEKSHHINGQTISVSGGWHVLD
jgi:NAD(P)-dependent dehydrogenase (short-subunit alcohol dehydrogenase family)